MGELDYHLYGLLVVIACAFYTDVTTHRIPNLITLGATVGGLVYHLISGGLHGLAFSLLGFGVGFGLFFLLYVCRAVGAGDVKLFGAIGAIAGASFTLYTAMYSIIYAGVIGILFVILRKKARSRLKELGATLFYFLLLKKKPHLSMEKEETLRFPFMYAVLPGVVTALYYMYVL